MKRIILTASLIIAAHVSLTAANITINTSSQRLAISPYIYGTNQLMEGGENTTLYRLGGNRMTGYNWENNYSNAGSDWYHTSDTWLCSTNYGYGADCSSPGGLPRRFHQESVSQGMTSIITVPMAGFVSADQASTVTLAETAPSSRWKQVVPKKGSAFAYPPDMTDNYVYADEMVNYLYNQFGGAASPGGIKFYALDNEPALWENTHPRIHPSPCGAVELINRSTATAKAVKDVDPNAEIFGPVFYGFWAMRNLDNPPDWASQQGSYQWYLDYYLANMKAASDADGRRLLDVLDMHWYSEARETAQGYSPPYTYNTPGVCRITEDTCVTSAAQIQRMQAPRTLWDASYRENSAIAQWYSWSLPLIPKVQASINTYYPGTKIAFTEYAHGGGEDYSGGISMADTLGIFGKYGVYAATMWKTAYGPYHSAAFKLFRNYDGANGEYGSTGVQCDSNDIPNVTSYASINGGDESELHIIMLNKAAVAQTVNTGITSPYTYTAAEAWAFDGSTYTITARAAPVLSGNSFSYSLPAHSAYHFVLRSFMTPTQTPYLTATPTFTVTLTRTQTPFYTATPTPSFSPTVPVTILNTCDSLAYNGALSGGPNSTVSINSAVGAAITEGTGSFRIDITGTAGWNDDIMRCDGIVTNDWSGFETLTLDVYVDPANLPWLAGSGYHELQLFVDTSNGKDYRKISMPYGISPGMNHLVIILDPALDTDPHTTQPNPAQLEWTDPIVNYFFVLNSDSAYLKTGTIFLDNLVLHSKPGTATLTRTQTSTMTATRTFSATWTCTDTATPQDTPTETPFVSNTETPTITEIVTGTPPTPTGTPTNTATHSVTGTATMTPTQAGTASYTATASHTFTRTATLTRTPAASVTRTPTAIPQPSGTATPTATAVSGYEFQENALTEIAVYPNPLDTGKGDAYLRFHALQSPDRVYMSIYTLNFRKIRELNWEPNYGGHTQMDVSLKIPQPELGALSNGMYYFYVKTVNWNNEATSSGIGTLVILK